MGYSLALAVHTQLHWRDCVNLGGVIGAIVLYLFCFYAVALTFQPHDRHRTDRRGDV